MKGADERDSDLVLDGVPGNSRQPVVGVHHIGRTPAEIVENEVGELRDDSFEFFLAQIEGTRRNVDDGVVGFDVDLARKARAPLTGVGGALDAGVGQGRHQFAHVHVHPARVADTGLGQRRGVVREHRHPRHRRLNLSAVGEEALIGPPGQVSPGAGSRPRRRRRDIGGPTQP